MESENTFSPDIAIISMSGRFPGSPSVEAYWQQIRDGVDLIARFSEQELADAGVSDALLHHPRYVRAHGSLDDIDRFDAHFFGYLPREAEILDPQQRLFLECAWEAIERAGYNTETFDGRIGVYAGASMSSYMLLLYANPHVMEALGSFQALLGNDKDFLATRVAYKLNLRGPALSVQTACSTSLVAVHLACQGLLNGECDIALAGGVSIGIHQKSGYLYQEGGIHSPDGYCRAFDASAGGTVGGSGVGVVVLKRLDDALADGDPVHAVIRGFAINNDGALKVGYTAPSVDGQAEVIRDALALAQVDAETIGYVETHGTATPLGDPIEVAALTKVFRESTDAATFCALGSVKTNIGHLDAAAGVAGLIKAVMALKHGQIPPSLHFEQPNPQIDFTGSPFYVSTHLADWPRGDTPRRAGVSSFGIGGTNAHVVLEEAPPLAPPDDPSRSWHVLPLSARTSTALAAVTEHLAEYLRQHPEVQLADVAYTLQLGRRAFEHRQTLVASDVQDALSALSAPGSNRVLRGATALQERPVVFMFPGQGAQYLRMAQDIYRHEPIFREHLDRCATLFARHLGLDLRDVLYPTSSAHTPDDLLSQTWITQPALFAVEYALAQLWISWGVKPVAMIGHSLGEYVAACLADVFALEDAIALVAARGRLMHQCSGGGMLSVSLAAEALLPLLNDRLSLAAINGPALCVAAGSATEIDRLEQRLAAQDVRCRRLPSAYAFHSAHMDSIVDVFVERVRSVTLRPPTIPFVSNVTGTWATASDVMNPRYWASQLRQTVRFADGVATLIENPHRVLLEVGPGRTLISLARPQTDAAPGPVLLSSLRHPQEDQPDEVFLLATLGRLWLAGVPVDWAALYAERRQRLQLPTYPFERQRYWVEPQALGIAPPSSDRAAPPAAQATPAPTYLRPDLPNEYVAPRSELEQKIALIWQESLGIGPIGVYDNFFELGGHSLIATELIFRVRELFPVELPLHSLFETPTIAGLAELLEAKLIEKIATLSDEEIRLLM
ncbi:MAG TPA: beta-ketoacyl synthase N-terminal-like domain-containing protein [Herpetosiphonaceae bacterium]